MQIVARDIIDTLDVVVGNAGRLSVGTLYVVAYSYVSIQFANTRKYSFLTIITVV